MPFPTATVIANMIEEPSLSSFPHVRPLDTYARKEYEREITDNLEHLLAVLPPSIAAAVTTIQSETDRGGLLEIVRRVCHPHPDPRRRIGKSVTPRRISAPLKLAIRTTLLIAGQVVCAPRQTRDSNLTMIRVEKAER